MVVEFESGSMSLRQPVIYTDSEKRRLDFADRQIAQAKKDAEILRRKRKSVRLTFCTDPTTNEELRLLTNSEQTLSCVINDALAEYLRTRHDYIAKARRERKSSTL